jgi:prepilin-type N-terminal cleavage/methylation domain-containing protein
MNKKGLNLMELIIVTIVIGILASLAIPQFTKVVEKSRSAEARSVMGAIRSAQEAYRQEYSFYASQLSPLNLSVPTTCNASFYFSYGVSGGGASYTATATRCTTGGKNPPSR